MITISFEENGVLEIDGVRISIAYIKEVINHPPSGLFSFMRVGNEILAQPYRDSESARKFFDRQTAEGKAR